MAKYKVEISGINTNDLKVLSQDDMNKLFKKVKEGDEYARDLLVEGNLKLIFSIIRKYQSKTDNLDDLFQIGCIGLLKAIDNFDLSHEVKFSTYAVPMILGEIRRYIRDNNSIRISRSVKDLAYKTLRMQEAAFQKTGKKENIEEIAKKLKVTTYEINNALESLKEPVSIFEPIYNDGGDTIFLCDQIEDKKITGDSYSNHLAIENAIDDLDKREKYILDERYVYGKTQMEIAKDLEISQAQVSRLEKGAIKSLKKVLK